MKLPRINPKGIAAPPGAVGLRTTPDDQVAQAAGQLGQQIGQSATRISADELKARRFDAALKDKEDRATRNTVFRRSLFGLKNQAFTIQQRFLEDPEPETMAIRANKSLTEASANFGSQITNEQDREQFNLQSQALTQSLTTSARTIGLRKMRDQGLEDGILLGDEILERFSRDPSISDSDFAGGVDAFHEHNARLEDADLITKVERQKLNAGFDDKLGGIVQQQDETLAVESGSHFLMLQHLIRVQSGFYKIAPEDVPTVIEQAIARQSTHLNNLEVKEGKRAVAREKQFNIALDLGDVPAASAILGRPVLESEFQTNMKGLVLEGFRKGVVTDPATVNAVEAEIEEAQDFSIDTNQANITEGLLKATTVDEVDEIITELISPKAKRIFGQSTNGPEARRELLKEAGTKKDKLITQGRSDEDETLKKEIQLAEKSLDAKKETGIFGAFGTKATNEKIATMKRLLHLRVKQGQRPFEALAELEKQFEKTPGNVAAEGAAGFAARVPFHARAKLLRESVPLTENEFDDEELRELIRFRDKFIEKTVTFIEIGEQETQERLEKERKDREERDNSLFNTLKKLIPE